MDTTPLWIEAEAGLSGLFAALLGRGYKTYGVVEEDGCFAFGPVARPEDLPRGRILNTEAGRVRSGAGATNRFFDKILPTQGLKRFVHPAQETISRVDPDFTVSTPPPDAGKIAAIGVRACDVAALGVLDRVFRKGPIADTRYASRREGLLIIAVDCAVPLETCFCASMGTGPHATSGFDLAITEISESNGHGFLIRAGSDAGTEILNDLDCAQADDADLQAVEAQKRAAVAAMGRQMPANVEVAVKNGHDSQHWADVASRCLSCANCTMVCPTCFCSTVEDRNSLDGTAWRERRWDSCFSIDFTYIHGGGLRQSGESRYRQWMSHKLGHWHDQFGESGCVGCGRCIAWCPVGIDITKEAEVLAAEFERRSEPASQTVGDNNG